MYEDRRTESIKNISEAETKRAKVDDLLQVIEERLNELEEEKKELKEFSTRDRERRCLEYSIYQRELSDVTAKLNEVGYSSGQETSFVLELTLSSDRSKTREPMSPTQPTRPEMHSLPANAKSSKSRADSMTTSSK